MATFVTGDNLNAVEITDPPREEPTIPMPVKQYAECVMALQKLADIKAALWTPVSSTQQVNEWYVLVKMLREIVGEYEED